MTRASLPVGLVLSLLAAGGQETATAPIAKDVVLVLDNSGSMRANDPENLTRKVVSDFLARLDSLTRVGIVVFDESARLVVPLSPANAAATRQAIAASLSGIDYRGQWTDSPAGVERASYELRSNGREGAAKTIIFLTDGIVDTGDRARDLERARWLVDNLAAECERLGIRVFSIAFTEQADFQLIQALGERTKGGYFRALTADEIQGVFSSIEAALVTPPPLPPPPPPPTPSGGMTTETQLLLGLGIIVLGIVAIGVGRHLKSAPQPPPRADPVAVPRASLKDVREITGVAEHEIRSAITTIGRAETNDVIIAKPTVSTAHATIKFQEGAFYLEDSSSNGTFLSGERIHDKVRLRHGDRIRFDEYEFVFAVAELEREMKTQLRSGPARPLVEDAQPVGGVAPEDPPTWRKDMCPSHPALRATELCLKCGIAYCEQCLVGEGEERMCKACAGKQEGGRP
jgi:pSer/pThr/pTyr-binding forkhead associated (FHA) protein/Mg-chelatase subunit ChlD